MASNSDGVTRFGEFELDTASGELRRRGRPIRLAPQTSRLLGALIERAGELVPRGELQRLLWGEGTFVDFDAGLNFCLRRLRAALGDEARAPRFIETVPRRGYRFVAAVTRPNRRLRTLAVLPFQNLGGDAAEEYFADGVTDGLITELGKIASLRVISRQSVLQLKGSQLGLEEIARRLRADVFVEGTVLHAGDRLRVTAQLVEPNPERHLWAESFEDSSGAIFGLVGRAARAVASAAQGALSPNDDARLATCAPALGNAPTREAETEFLKARFHLGKWSGTEIEQGIACLERAIDADPEHAPSHAALSNCLFLLGYWGHLPWQVAYARAEQAARRALAIDASLSLAHVALAWLQLCYDWDFDGCDASIRAALACGPNNEWAHLCHAFYRSWICEDPAGALAPARTALALDPVSPFTNSSVAWLLLFARHYEAAERQASDTLDLYPDAQQALCVLGWAHVARGHLGEATAAFERAAALSADPMTLGFLGHVYARSGRSEEAHALLDRLLARAESGGVPAKSVTAVYAGLGEVDHAFEWLERGLRDRDGSLLSLLVSPAFEPLTSDPRFGLLAVRIGLRGAVRDSIPAC